MEDLLMQGCPAVLQAVIVCDDSFEEVIAFPGVSFESRTPDNGYGFGVPGVDTGAPPPMTVSLDGTWFGSKVSARILKTGIVSETTAPDFTDSPLSDLFFCDRPTCGVTTCGSTEPSNGCRTAYAVMDDGDSPVIAEYHISAGGAVTFVSSQTLTNTNGLVGGSCIDGRLVVTDGTCVYTNCGSDGLTKVVLPADVIAGSIKGVATAQGTTDHYYVLFGTSGVVHSKNGRTWETVLEDNFFAGITQQTDIKAIGDVVVTYGDEATIQFNNAAGDGSWYERTVTTAPTATDPVVALAIDKPNPFNQRYAYIYAVTQGTTELTIHFSGDDGVSWEARRTFTATPSNPESISMEAAVNGSRVYLSWDSTFWVNFNYACECDWVDLSPDLACGSTKMAVCSYDPNRVFMMSDGVCGIFARDDVAYTPSGNPANPVVIDILYNDRAAETYALDPSTVVLTPVLPTNAQSVSVNVTTGAVTLTPDDGFEGLITFSYDVNDTNGNTATADVVVIVGNPDATALVC